MSPATPPARAADAPVVSRGDVAAGMGRLGIGAGETVFFHSSLRSLGYV